jgi:hypothetical protein
MINARLVLVSSSVYTFDVSKTKVEDNGVWFRFLHTLIR